MTSPVRVDALSRAECLGKGGQGTVWAVPDRMINGQWPVAFKEYSAECRRELNGSVLEEMVAFVPGLPSGTGRWLCERLAWPAAVVADDQGRTGFLMRLVPDDFFVTSDLTGRKLAGFEFLLNGEGYLDRMGIAITDRQRLQLLLDLSGTLAKLHRLGIVVGDLSPKNVLYRLEPEPGCFLIDCDAMRLKGRDALSQRETPDWALPEGEELATRAGDSHKFGLLAIRLLAGVQNTRDTGDAARVSTELGRLAEASLHDDPGLRPALSDWSRPLSRAIKGLASTAGGVPSSTMPNGAPPSSAPPRFAPPSSARPPYVPRTPPPGTGRGGSRRVGRVVARMLLVAALGYGAVQGCAALRDAGHSQASSVSGDANPSAGSVERTGESSADPAAERSRDQAARLDALLGHNDGTRQQVTSAVNTVSACGARADLRAAADRLRTAGGERDKLLAQLKGIDPALLPGGSAMVGRLRDAWTASALADRAFARWADAVAAGGCGGSAPQTADWDEAVRQSAAATEAKRDFVAAWNQVAGTFGLTVRVADAI